MRSDRLLIRPHLQDIIYVNVKLLQKVTDQWAVEQGNKQRKKPEKMKAHAEQLKSSCRCLAHKDLFTEADKLMMVTGAEKCKRCLNTEKVQLIVPEKEISIVYQWPPLLIGHDLSFASFE